MTEPQSNDNLPTPSHLVPIPLSIVKDIIVNTMISFVWSCPVFVSYAHYS